MRCSPCALAVASLTIACASAHGAGTFSAAPDAGLAQCTFPASMVPPGEPGAWAVGHALLSCKDGSASTVCLSDDGRTCPGNFVAADGTCTSECGVDEYAVEYGGSPTSTSIMPSLPEGCHDPGVADFDEVTYACCPCE
jgi:hypothetical protein